MKFLLLASVVALTQARPSSDSVAPIVRQSYDISPEGSFSYAYETGNGIAASAQGGLKQQGSEYPGLEVQGSFSYFSPEGENVQMSYLSDENGFQPQGSHLPVPPPTPEAILRALKYIEDHPPPPPPAAFSSLRG